MENDRQTPNRSLVVETKKKRFRSFVLREKKVVFCVFRELTFVEGKTPQKLSTTTKRTQKGRERERESLGRKALVGEKKKKKKKKRFALSLFVSFDDDVQQRR